jgi:hypothetical protein
MPYADRERQKRAQRESARRRRARGSTGSTSVVALPTPPDGPGLTPDGVLAIVGAELETTARGDIDSDRTRAVCTAASTWARIYELANVNRHVEAVRVLTDRAVS